MVGEPDYILIDFVILISGDCTSSCGRGERGCSSVQVQLASSSSRVQCSKTPNKAPNIQRHNPIKLLTESGPMSPQLIWPAWYCQVGRHNWASRGREGGLQAGFSKVNPFFRMFVSYLKTYLFGAYLWKYVPGSEIFCIFVFHAYLQQLSIKHTASLAPFYMVMAS